MILLLSSIIFILVVFIVFLINRGIKYKKEYKKTISNIQEQTKNSIKKSKAVTRGQAHEQILPLLEGFEYNLSDCRFLGTPIDYIIYEFGERMSRSALLRI